MACELVQREFTRKDGTQVLVGCRQLAASKALDLHVELVGKAGRAIFPFIENTFGFNDILVLMSCGGKDNDIGELVRRVVCMATIEGDDIKPATFDIRMDGDLMLIHKIFGLVLEANFLDFFKEGQEINAQRRLEAEALSKTEEQKNSIPS